MTNHLSGASDVIGAPTTESTNTDPLLKLALEALEAMLLYTLTDDADKLARKAIKQIRASRSTTPSHQGAAPTQEADYDSMDEAGQNMIDLLQSALAECRDCFQIPAPGSPLENAWAQAIGDPLSVPAYVRASFDSALGAAPTQAEPTQFDKLYEYAQEHRLDYNELCRVVRSATSMKADTQPAGVALPANTFRQGNWSHPDGDGSRIVGWCIPAADVKRMGANAFCLPHEVSDALARLSAACGVQASAATLDPAYMQRLIDALQENGDPVSIDAADEFQRLLDGVKVDAPAQQPLSLPPLPELPEYRYSDGRFNDHDMREYARQAVYQATTPDGVEGTAE